MMASDDAEDDVPPWVVSYVALYENERFWVGGGFSKSGLLPTDRHPYSTDDGSLSWKKLEKASAAMLEKGWVYVDPEFKPPDAEVDGWRYSSDFSLQALQRASDKRRKLSDFVRRRKLVRKTKFDPAQFLPRHIYSKCDHCDSNVIDLLSSNLLDALSLATLLQQNNAQHVLTDTVAFTIKKKLIESLGIGLPLPDGFPVNPMDRIEQLNKELREFPKKQQSVLSKAYHLLDNGPDEETHTAYVSAKYFSKEERDAIASLVVRYLDPEFELHCDKEMCGEDCMFCIVNCPNKGCDRKISRNHLEEHDTICGFCVIPCPKACGDTFPRNKQEVHLKEACSLREVACPFRTIGCPAMMMAKNAEQHLVDNSNGHLLMAMNRMMEYQAVMSKMNYRIEQLEKDNLGLKKQVAENNTGLVKDVASVNKKLGALTKKVTTLDNTCKSEFKNIHKQERSNQK